MTPESLCSIIGEPATLALLSLRPGVRLYVPRSATERFIGELGGDKEAAEALARECGGMFIALPVAREWRAAILRKRGMSARDVALALGITERTAHRLKSISEARCRHEPSFSPAVKNVA